MVQWIKPGSNIDFIGRFKLCAIASTTAVALSFAALIFNVFYRGAALNYGTDFKGGSEVEVEFSRDVPASKVRQALDVGGFNQPEVVAMKDARRAHVFLLRLVEVSSFSAADQQKAKQLLDAAFGGAIRKLNYSEGGDKLYVSLGEKTVITNDNVKQIGEQVEQAFTKGGISLQAVQLFGRLEDRTFEVTLGGLADELRKTFEESLGKGVVKDIPAVESVGAKAGKQMRDDGIKAIAYSLLLILVYIALRFDFQFAPGAIIALMHDVIITVGIFAVTWTEFSLPVVAALMTLAGYSVNDTIVVYDRIRENIARLRGRELGAVVNASVNETLSRTIITSLATLLTCVAMWLLGTGVIKTFSFALTVGIVVGTYSSVFVAAPMTVWFKDRIAEATRRRAEAR